jgi:DNA-binding NtrC family response regulator
MDVVAQSIPGMGVGMGKEALWGVVLPPGGTRLDDAMAAYERMVIREAIGRHNGNITRTAKELGISRLRLRKRLRVMADHKLD